MRAVTVPALALLLAACSDYQLSGPEDEEKGGELDEPDDGESVLDQDDTGDDDGGEDDVPVETASAPTYINTATTLFAWDPDGGLAEIADFWVNSGEAPRVTDIAIDNDGYLYGCSNGFLWRIHAETGQAIIIAELEQYLGGLTFVSDGRLVGAGDGVWIIDPSDGSTQELVPEGRYATSGDIIGLPDGLLYWTVWGEDDGDPDRLVVIDPDTGRTTERGDTGVERIFGLGYADGELYGFTDTGSVLTLDADFGGGTGERPLGDVGGWWGATTNPVRW